MTEVSHVILPSMNFTDNKSTLVQVMAWCRQATSHYLSQCWPRSMSPNGVTRAQWVNEPIVWHLMNISFHCTFHCLFKTLSRLAIKKPSKLCITGLCWESSGNWLIQAMVDLLHEISVMQKVYPCHHQHFLFHSNMAAMNDKINTGFKLSIRPWSLMGKRLFGTAIFSASWYKN